MEKELQLIREAVFRLQPLEPDEWDMFAAALQCRSFAKGDFLIREGQVEQYIYFLNSGATRHFFIRDGKEFTVDFRFAGDFVTAYYSLITREPSAVFITFLEEASVWAIPYRSILGFYDRYKNGERIGRMIAEDAYVRRLRREMELLSLTAEERYARLMALSPQLISQLSVKHLSSYLGVQPESLSRIRKAFGKS